MNRTSTKKSFKYGALSIHQKYISKAAIYICFAKSHFPMILKCKIGAIRSVRMSVLCMVSAYLSLGSLLAVYLCISATIRSLWFPNSFFSAFSRATSEALGPLLFSASCTVFREDSICWKDTHLFFIPITFKYIGAPSIVPLLIKSNGAPNYVCIYHIDTPA